MSTGISKDAQRFERRLNALQFLASRYPAWTARTELSPFLTGHIRTQQRLLRDWVAIGLLECDKCNPVGYRVVQGKVLGFRLL